VIYFDVPITPDTREALIRCHVKGDVYYLLATSLMIASTADGRIASTADGRTLKPYDNIGATNAHLSWDRTKKLRRHVAEDLCHATTSPIDECADT
jgi:hypothetical protein